MTPYTSAEAQHFAEQWLPAWTGNRPEFLAGFYSDDSFYLDPGVPAGISGKTELLGHFKKLLGYNPNCSLTGKEKYAGMRSISIAANI
jgi:hypothetical protein